MKNTLWTLLLLTLFAGCKKDMPLVHHCKPVQEEMGAPIGEKEIQLLGLRKYPREDAYDAVLRAGAAIASNVSYAEITLVTPKKTWEKMRTDPSHVGEAMFFRLNSDASDAIQSGSTYKMTVSLFDAKSIQLGSTVTAEVLALQIKDRVKNVYLWGSGTWTGSGSSDLNGHLRLRLNNDGAATTTVRVTLTVRYSNSTSKYTFDDGHSLDYSKHQLLAGQGFLDFDFNDKNSWKDATAEGSVQLLDEFGWVLDEYTIKSTTPDANLFDTKAEPVLQNFRIYSKDKGENWTIECSVADYGNWVDNSTGSIKAEGKNASPIKGKFGLSYAGRDKSGAKVYSMVLNTKDNGGVGFVSGQEYSISLRLNGLGTGTRTSSAQASTKAELL